ncbi:unnamed protein product [Gordionus sp. m RMFG-2023]
MANLKRDPTIHIPTVPSTTRFPNYPISYTSDRVTFRTSHSIPSWQTSRFDIGGNVTTSHFPISEVSSPTWTPRTTPFEQPSITTDMVDHNTTSYVTESPETEKPVITTELFTTEYTPFSLSPGSTSKPPPVYTTQEQEFTTTTETKETSDILPEYITTFETKPPSDSSSPPDMNTEPPQPDSSTDNGTFSPIPLNNRSLQPPFRDPQFPSNNGQSSPAQSPLPSFTNSTQENKNTICSNIFDSFTCKDGKGIHSCTQYCDGKDDCADKSDEDPDCKCSAGEKKCKGGGCLHSFKFCDKVHDCPKEGDYSDEMDCVCDKSEFKCRNGLCMDEEQVYCNKVNDCGDNSDEPANCTCLGRDRQFECLTEGICIPSISKCDGHVDCRDKGDELNCSCPSDTKFKCDGGVCKILEKKCDGYRDCEDGSDEENC